MIAIALVILATTTAGIFTARRYGDRADRASRLSMTLVLWVLIPIVMFFNLARFEFSAEIGAALGFAHLANLAVVALAYLIGRHALRLTRPQLGALMTCALLGNTAYLGLPFTAAALGFDQLGAAVSYDTMVMLPTMLLIGFSIGAAFGTIAERPRDRVRSFFTRNPVLYAAIAALLAPDSLAPDWTLDLTRIIVISILPLGFFAVGVTLFHEAEEDRFGFPPPLTPPVATAVILKLSIPAGILALISSTLLHIPDAYLLEAAMSSGINNLLIAHTYGLDRKLAASAIIWSTMLVVTAGVVFAVA